MVAKILLVFFIAKLQKLEKFWWNIESDEETKYGTFYWSSKAEKSIKKSDIDDVYKSIYTTIMSKIQKSLRKGSGWINDSVVDHTINISKYKPLSGSSYIRLPKELDHPKNSLINIQNIDDNEGFNGFWSHTNLHPADHHLLRIRKDDKNFARELNFEDIKFPVKIRDVDKIEKLFQN